MRLKSVTLENFRGYRTRTTIPIDPCITGITGKNDAGKSTILEALDVFFEGGEISLDKDDFNVNSPSTPIEITCVFDDVPGSIVIDESSSTTLESEYLLDADGCLQIKKLFKPSTPTKPQVLLVTQHPTGEVFGDLHSLTIQKLKERARSVGVSEDSITDKRKSSLWRKAIWAAAEDLDCQQIELDIAKELRESKDICDQIVKRLPLFALFRSDRESKDNDPHAKNPLQEAVKLAQAELRDEIDALQLKIQSQVEERAQEAITKLREMDPALAAKLFPRFKSQPKWTFDFSLDGDDEIPINKRGSGVRRLILLNFFRAEAERRMRTKDAPSVIYAIEEPETSQHPSNQELLIRSLLSLSSSPNCQVLVTTHVPALAGLLPIAGLRFVSSNPSGAQVEFGNDDVLELISKSLGVLPDREAGRAKALLLVEGPGDVTFFSHAASALESLQAIPGTLKDRGIGIIAIGGCGNLKHWVIQKTAEQFGIPWAIFLDSDLGTKEHGKNQAAIRTYVPHGVPAFLSRKREPENYILPEVVQPHVKVPTSQLTYTETCDAKQIIGDATQVRQSDIIDRFWVLMTPEQIRSVEEYTDIDGEKRYELTEAILTVLNLVQS